jgi:Raf kinase inhibitor-like YbhB/YbcL family protein
VQSDAGVWYAVSMHVALRALSLVIVVGIVAITLWLFATDSVEAPLLLDKNTSMTLSLTSPAFQNDARIPARFTCDGEGTSPALDIAGVPSGVKSLVLLVDDPDVPKQLKPDGVFDHWVLFNISPATTLIPEGSTAGMTGANGAGKNAYTGPCPPTQYQPTEHRYFFRLYALDMTLDLPAGATKEQVLDAMKGHVLDETVLVGKYDRAAR